MLVVKPNPRRMRYMRDSASEGIGGSAGRPRTSPRLRWDRVFAIAVAGVVVAGLIAWIAYH